MKVYVVVYNNWQDYEGGGGENVGIFSSREKAFAKVKAELPAKERASAKEDDTEWYLPEVPASSYWYTIEEHEVE